MQQENEVPTTDAQETKPVIVVKVKDEKAKREFKEKPVTWATDPKIRERLLHLKFNLQQQGKRVQS